MRVKKEQRITVTSQTFPCLKFQISGLREMRTELPEFQKDRRARLRGSLIMMRTIDSDEKVTSTSLKQL